MARLPLELPSSLRQEFKSPFGPVYTDVTQFLTDAGRPIIAVGDIVTYHLQTVDYTPAVAVIDGQTKRESVDETVKAALSKHNKRIDVENQPGTISIALLEALQTAVERICYDRCRRRRRPCNTPGGSCSTTWGNRRVWTTQPRDGTYCCDS